MELSKNPTKMGIGNSFFTYCVKIVTSHIPQSQAVPLSGTPPEAFLARVAKSPGAFFFLNSVDVPFVAGFYHKWNIAMENQRV